MTFCKYMMDVGLSLGTGVALAQAMECCLSSAISQFGVNGQKLMGGLNYYSRETYEKWGII